MRLIITSTAALAVLVSSASAHTRVFSAWVNGVDQGDGRATYIRSPPNNNPVKDLTSPDLSCNVAGSTAKPDFVSAAAGDTVSLEWYHNTRGDDTVAKSHKGPILTYIAPYMEDGGADAVWTKIDEDGFDGTSWAVDKLISNGGKKDFTIPSDLKAGKYLVRQEIIALHEADAVYTRNPARGAQFFMSCVQFNISGDGSSVPNQDFAFNGGYNYDDPGISFDLYSKKVTSYSVPGPAVDAQLTSGTARKHNMGMEGRA